MIFNVKKRNFFIYLFSLVAGFILISIAATLLHFNNSIIIANIFLSIGCSTMPSIIVAYLVDRANETRDLIKVKKLRDSFLWGMPYGLLWIARVIIEEYYPFDNASNISFYSCFKQGITKLRLKRPSSKGIFEYENERNNLMNKLDYGISLCLRDCKALMEHDFELEINSIFNKDEMLNIKYLYEECEKIKHSYVLSETAEYIELFIKTVYEGINEVKIRLDRNIVFKNRYIDNWFEISK